MNDKLRDLLFAFVEEQRERRYMSSVRIQTLHLVSRITQACMYAPEEGDAE
jgi:hypothetical protein